LLVEGVLDLSVSLRWYAGLDVPGRQRFAELFAVIAFENGGGKLDHGSGGIGPLRAA
jgi:hypothetical protein